MEHTEKIIGFASELVPLVIDGSKVLTYRLGDKWDMLSIGDTIFTKDSGTGKIFAKLEIIKKDKGTFGTLSEDTEGHERYQSKEQRRQTFEKYYNRSVTDSETLIIFGFKVVKLL